MHKASNNTKVIQSYMESLAIHTGVPTLHWKDNIRCISVVESKIVTPKVKTIRIPVCFL